ncbi:hypothetical protein BT69DRAFT_1350665 [Atractiella rhizophila]|nr:hypothetical protein BT69DRAFT_1350665 [Atractiella rhizophila]
MSADIPPSPPALTVESPSTAGPNSAAIASTAPAPGSSVSGDSLKPEKGGLEKVKRQAVRPPSLSELTMAMREWFECTPA